MKCFYHDDLDGRAAAFCVYAWVGIYEKKENGEADYQFYPMDYSKPFPFEEIKLNEHIWIVDYSIKPEEMDRLLEITKNVTWIDHHKTAIERYANYPHYIRGIRKDGEAACILTWKYIHWWTRRGDGPEKFEAGPPSCGLKVPLVIELIGDRDIWVWKYGDKTKFFHAAAQSYDTSPESEFWWKCIERERDVEGEQWFNALLERGRGIEEYRKRFYADYRAALAFPVIFEGHKALALNVARIGSEAFGGDEAFKDYDILITFVYDGRQFTVSLYSKTIDVAEIAKRYGGGGHKGAAGFQCTKLPFEHIN